MTTQIQMITGAGAASAAADLNEAGFRTPRRYNIGQARIDEANDFLLRWSEGRVNRAQVAESFSTSDFTMAAFAAVDQRMMEAYDALPKVWRQYTDVVTVNDFRPQRLLDRWNSIVGLKLVPEGTEYPMAAKDDKAVYFINVLKYGLRDALTFEANINNEAIGEIQDMPGRLANAADETETINALSNLLKVDPATNLASDINTDFFKTANGNAPETKPLTPENLDAALTKLASSKAKNGRRVAMPQLQVIIPSSLRMTAQRIKALRQLEVTNGDTKQVYDNFLQSVDFVEEPLLDVINTHAKATTTWFIVPKTNSKRPALFAAFLRGHETVDLRVKNDQGMRVGGGSIDPLEGSFDIDDIQYRARHIVGHQTGDPLFTYASYGA